MLFISKNSFLRSFGLFNGLKHSFGVLKFNLPDLGEKIKEGTIKKIYVKEGDPVSEFQKLADVASDKQFTEITASDAGIIKKVYYKEEQVCQVGDLFLQIQTKDEGSPHHKIQTPSTSKQAQKQKPTPSKQQSGKTDNEILCTPFVRGLIKKHNLDAQKIKGSGQNGRILEKDVELLISKKSQPSVEPSKYKPLENVNLKVPAGDKKTIQMTPFQKGMQKSMTQSNTIPHLYLHEEFDITEAEQLRKSLKDHKIKITLMGILIKTFSMALKKFPRVNASYDPQKNEFQYTVYPNHNISIAIDSPNGLVVPNIKNVQDLSLLDIQSELQRLRLLSTEAKLTANQLQGGTVALSNIGTIGGINACPLILPPQVCIVAIGKMQSLPKYRHGALVERKVLQVSYGCDHRVIDGATVARFSNQWKELIENPSLVMASLK